METALFIFTPSLVKLSSCLTCHYQGKKIHIFLSALAIVFDNLRWPWQDLFKNSGLFTQKPAASVRQAN